MVWVAQHPVVRKGPRGAVFGYLENKSLTTLVSSGATLASQQGLKGINFNGGALSGTHRRGVEATSFSGSGGAGGLPRGLRVWGPPDPGHP
eukprot:583336-Pyramimonas_sp.AAC.1